MVHTLQALIVQIPPLVNGQAAYRDYEDIIG